MLYYLMLIVMLAFPFFYFRAVKDFSWEKTIGQLLPKRLSWKEELLGGLKLFVILFAAFIILSTILSFLGINDLEKVNSAVKEMTGEGAISVALTLGIVLFIEEFFFRAFLQKRVGIVPSTLVFTALHLGYGSIAETIGVFALGLILAYWYKKNNSLFQNYLGHIIYDLVAIVLYLTF